MVTAALFSVRPQWIQKISTGDKTVEVRKTAPKLALPYKAYLYCTKAKEPFCLIVDKGNYQSGSTSIYTSGGVVVGEFVCDAECLLVSNSLAMVWKEFEVPGTCLSGVEILKYLGNGKSGYGLHIASLTIYDKPRDLSEFRRMCKNGLYCESCAMYNENSGKCGNSALYLHRPPVSWCYVEEAT